MPIWSCWRVSRHQCPLGRLKWAAERDHHLQHARADATHTYSTHTPHTHTPHSTHTYSTHSTHTYSTQHTHILHTHSPHFSDTHSPHSFATHSPHSHAHSSATHSPHSHALLDVSGCHLVAQVHHKLGKLLDIDDVLGVLGVGVDDLGASVTDRASAFQRHTIRTQKEN